MNFDEAIKAHSAWKMKLSKYLRSPDGSLDPKDIEPDNLCPLGKWIYAEGANYNEHQEFKDLKKCHTQFHKCAAQVVKDADSGKNITEEIALGSDSDYARVSKEVVSLLMTMKKKVK